MLPLAGHASVNIRALPAANKRPLLLVKECGRSEQDDGHKYSHVGRSCETSSLFVPEPLPALCADKNRRASS